MSEIAEAPVASNSAPTSPRTRYPAQLPEVKRIAKAFAGVRAYVGLYYDRETDATKAVGLTRLYGRMATLGEVAGVALAELGALGPDRYDFACVLRVGEADVATGGVSVRVNEREMHSLAKRRRLVIEGPKWESPAAQRKAESETLALLEKVRHHVAVLYDEEWDIYMVEPLYDLLGIEAKGAELGELSMWALGQYDVATTVLVAALEIGKFENGFNARFCHSQLAVFA